MSIYNPNHHIAAFRSQAEMERHADEQFGNGAGKLVISALDHFRTAHLNAYQAEPQQAHYEEAVRRAFDFLKTTNLNDAGFRCIVSNARREVLAEAMMGEPFSVLEEKLQKLAAPESSSAPRM